MGGELAPLWGRKEEGMSPGASHQDPMLPLSPCDLAGVFALSRAGGSKPTVLQGSHLCPDSPGLYILTLTIAPTGFLGPHAQAPAKSSPLMLLRTLTLA